MNRLKVICGAAGVGKSTYGRRVASELRACFLDSDTVTEEVVCAGMKAAGWDPKDRDSPEYVQAFRDAVYECLYRVAEENLPHLPVVMVGPFTREIANPNWKKGLSERFGCEVEVYFVTCPEEVRKERIRVRANPRDAWKLEHWADYMEKCSLTPPVFPHEIVQT
ncbi:MAG: AAA family ATPase [Verrucomicrobiaceae bacterium]